MIFEGKSDKFVVIVGSRIRIRLQTFLKESLQSVKCISEPCRETYLTAADEMLYPENRSYLDDILSYEAIGARSVENQQHRLTASGMDIPIGMKNPTSGDLSVMLNSVVAAQGPHRFIYQGMDVTTTGGNDLGRILSVVVASQCRVYLRELTTCNRNVETLVQRHSCLRSLTSWAKCLRNVPCQCTAHATARADIRQIRKFSLMPEHFLSTKRNFNKK